MSINALIRTLQHELALLEQATPIAHDRLARHCIQHRKQALGFQIDALQEIVSRFGEQDVQALPGLYDRLYGVLCQRAKRLNKQAEAIQSLAPPEKTDLLIESQRLNDRAARLSDFILVSSQQTPLPENDSPSYAQKIALTTTGIKSSQHIWTSRVRSAVSPQKAVVALGVLAAFWVTYSLFNRGETKHTQTTASEIAKKTAQLSSQTPISPLPSMPKNQKTTVASACFSWNQIPLEKYQDVFQLLEGNPLVQDLTTEPYASELWLLLPSDGKRVAVFKAAFETIQHPLGTPQPLPWISSKGWLLHADPSPSLKEKLLSTADGVNGTVVAKPPPSFRALSFHSNSELMIERLRSFTSKNKAGLIHACVPDALSSLRKN